jgi:hypothetical protein
MYTTTQAAQELGYSNDAVIRLMIKQKRLKAKKLGHIWVITPKELDRIKKNRYAKD